jgi:hypothetical protein
MKNADRKWERERERVREREREISELQGRIWHYG